MTAARRPDYARIAELERELGMAEAAEVRPMRAEKICLIKDCDGETVELRTWSGILVARLHHH
ncbi:hypothetical protein ACIRF8_15590 [Streptomyces sp. NPDC102406]|uniref:hypothetical protein n=1 Tax=Streptomyces sp. NPDC102406 TaxID=3366171 RepID=UPI003801632C